MRFLAVCFIAFAAAIIIPLIGAAQISAQNYEPKILILSPGQTSVDPSLQKELKDQNDTVAKQISMQANTGEASTKGLEGQPQNMILMAKNNLDYIQHLNFFKEASLYSSSYLAYKFYERFPNVLILLKDTSIAPGIAPMQKLATEQKMPYIINFAGIKLVVENSKKLAKVKVQLYEQSSNSFLIDQEYTGNDNNPGFEFACNEGTINCTINNVLSAALNDIANKIAANDPTLKKQRQLTYDRERWIRENLSHWPYDNSLLRTIIPVEDKSIDFDYLFQCLYNNNKTQFVAFFIKIGGGNSFESITGKNDGATVHIEMNGNSPNSASLDSLPNTYGYIVKGVKYNGKWYYEKDEVSYFNSSNLTDARLNYLNKLESFGYFKESSAEPSGDFWSGNLFEKIKDLKNDPSWGKNKEMWETEEQENRDYIGLYVIVADGLKQERKIERANYNKKIANEILLPFLNNQIKLKTDHIAGYDAVSDKFAPIYPKDRHIIIAPIKIIDEYGTASVRYFVIIPSTGKIYEWVYFAPNNLKKDEFPGELVLKAMRSITQWDFSYDTLDDSRFWSNDVLLKVGSDYKYLKQLN